MAKTANYLGIDKSTLDKWLRQLNPNKTSKRELTCEQQKMITLKKNTKTKSGQ
ncbi:MULTISPECIES: hypothetical protein [unclassified Gilliamella]|uniref:hypothetical protein n=1 Tax=unclassified Gilliamella TaxID=2685620 RepID=UPI00159EDD4A|nr:hypothetical protein [Gilliamella apicola]